MPKPPTSAVRSVGVYKSCAALKWVSFESSKTPEGMTPREANRGRHQNPNHEQLPSALTAGTDSACYLQERVS